MSTHEFRIEKDLLGEKPVPKDAFYGVQTLRAIENFSITGYKIHRSRIVAMGMVKKAAALANMEIGLLDKDIGEQIADASQAVIDGLYHEHFMVDPIQGGAGTSINMNANEVIANIALTRMGHEKGTYTVVDPNDHVNKSQSTNDSVPTSVCIATQIELNELLVVMESLHTTFKEKAAEFDSVIKMGRTHLQDAVPIRLGQEFDAYARVLKRDIQRISRTRQGLNSVNMGATAVGTGLNAEKRYIELVIEKLRSITGFPIQSAESLVDATQNSDVFAEVSAMLKVCMINMSKMANDLRIMASGPRCGLAEINLPERQPGSSIMPGKINPVMPELINQIAFQVIGNDNTICLAVEAGQLELNVMHPILVYNLIQSIEIMKNAFKSFNELCLKGITANEERLRNMVEQSVGIVTAINPHIGYKASSNIAREAIETGKSVREICLRDKILTAEQLDVILNPYEMTNIGISGASLLFKEK